MELQDDNKEYLIALIKADLKQGNYMPIEIALRRVLIETIQKEVKWVQDFPNPKVKLKSNKQKLSFINPESEKDVKTLYNIQKEREKNNR